jgi:phosphatidylglycerol:prolipoprotein diacylglycerol transferase
MSRSRRGPASRPAGSRQRPVRPGVSSPKSPPPVLSVQAPHDAADPDADALPQGLTATFGFDSGQASGPYPATVRFSGQRLDVTSPRDRGDGFVHEEAIDQVVPRSGPVSISARVYGVNAGEWSVQAELLSPPLETAKVRLYSRSSPPRSQPLEPARWSWRRWRLVEVSPHPLKSRWSRVVLLDPIPAVIPGSWTGLVTLGVVIGFIFQALLLPREGLAFGTVLPVSLLAVVAGVTGGKLWFIALNWRTWRTSLGDGFCIQGALAGAVAVGVGAVALIHVPIGLLLDTTAPGLFVGIAVGRLGCFFTGCCAGRPSSSWFAVWSSDRRVGARRLPTQPLESLAALCIGLAGLVLLLRYRLAVPGAIFVASMAAYTLCRQFILRLRGERRRSTRASDVIAVAAALVLCGAVVWLWLSAH